MGEATALVVGEATALSVSEAAALSVGEATALVVGEATSARDAAATRGDAATRAPLPAGLARRGRGEVVATWPGRFFGCANASLGVAVGTSRDPEGRLRLGDVVLV